MREDLREEEVIGVGERGCEEEVLKKGFVLGCVRGVRKREMREVRWEEIEG